MVKCDRYSILEQLEILDKHLFLGGNFTCFTDTTIKFKTEWELEKKLSRLFWIIFFGYDGNNLGPTIIYI